MRAIFARIFFLLRHLCALTVRVIRVAEFCQSRLISRNETIDFVQLGSGRTLASEKVPYKE